MQASPATAQLQPTGGQRVPARTAGFTLTDLLAILALLALLAAVVVPVAVRAGAGTKLAQCNANLRQVNQAVLQFANDHGHALPRTDDKPSPGGWWWYKEDVKAYAGLKGDSSPNDKVFACPEDRGYGEGGGPPLPFSQSGRHDFTSYVFNGVNLPGVPNIGGWPLAEVQQPARTLLTMEWTAHAPLSWHRSRTGHANTPFYSNAESVVGFVDGHVATIKIYYDGMNAAYTRDPEAGYAYQYSGN